MNKLVYLGLGSNLGDRKGAIERAIEKMAEQGIRVVRRSSLFETEPMELRDQPWFLNLVVEAETELFPRQLLNKILAIERELGRRRRERNGPREIDIDVLLYGKSVVRIDALEIPHPRMQDRRFVLAPLIELAPEMRHPVVKKTFRQLLETLEGQRVVQVAESNCGAPL